MGENFELDTPAFHLSATVSADRMKIFINAEPKENPQISGQELFNLLAEKVSRDLLHDGVINNIAATLSKGEAVKERRIAKGSESAPGTDGRVVFLLKRLTGEAAITPDDKGFVEFKELHLFDNVTTGTVVARIYPPHAGKDGIDVFGKPLPFAPGKPAKVTIDKTLELVPAASKEEPFDKIVAKVEGYLHDEGNSLSIKSELLIKGNVDYHSGNVDFIGTVVVKGDVLPGFLVKGKKGVTIQGSVQSGSVLSSEGAITVKGAILGGPGASVSAKGIVECRVAREAVIESYEGIKAIKEVANSTLKTHAAVRVEQGLLFGGRILVIEGVEAKEVGNDSGVETQITLCNTVETSAEYLKVMNQMEAHERTLALLELHLGPLAGNPSKISMLKGLARDRAAQLIKKKDEVSKSLLYLKGHRKNMLEKAEERKSACVSFRERLFEGVTILAADQAYKVSSEEKGPASIVFDPKEMKFLKGEFRSFEPAKKEKGSAKEEKK